jgi:predicted nucleic acid-binding protein
MQRFLLDTSALLAHFRQEPGGELVQALFQEVDTEILVASVSLTEFARRLRELGATVAEARQRVEDYQELLDEVVPIDDQVALTAFDIGCETAPRLPLADALIAAAARERGACLVHRDDHMAPIPAKLLKQLDLAKELDSRSTG